MILTESHDVVCSRGLCRPLASADYHRWTRGDQQHTWQMSDYSYSNRVITKICNIIYRFCMKFLLIVLRVNREFNKNVIICSSLWRHDYVLRLFWIFNYSVILVILTPQFNRIKPFILLKYVIQTDNIGQLHLGCAYKATYSQKLSNNIRFSTKTFRKCKILWVHSIHGSATDNRPRPYITQ